MHPERFLGGVVLHEDLVVGGAAQRGVRAVRVFGNDKQPRVLQGRDDHVAKLIGFSTAPELIHVNAFDVRERKRVVFRLNGGQKRRTDQHAGEGGHDLHPRPAFRASSS